LAVNENEIMMIGQDHMLHVMSLAN